MSGVVVRIWVWRGNQGCLLDWAARYGLKASIDYLIGDKLIMFAKTGESSPEFLGELPAFSKVIRKLFIVAQIQDHFERAKLASEVSVI